MIGSFLFDMYILYHKDLSLVVSTTVLFVPPKPAFSQYYNLPVLNCVVLEMGWYPLTVLTLQLMFHFRGLEIF